MSDIRSGNMGSAEAEPAAGMNPSPTTGKGAAPLSGRSLEIPKCLEGVKGVAQGFQPPGVNRSRFVIAGLSGFGKSTLLHNNPRAFVLDPEGGGDSVADPRALRYRAPAEILPGKQVEEYFRVARLVIAGFRRGQHELSMLGVDSYDKLIEIAMDDICAQHGIQDPLEYRDGRGNAYTIVRRMIFGLLEEAYRAGMGWCLLTHITPKLRRTGEEEIIRVVPAVSDSFAIAMRRECEHMLIMEVMERTVEGVATERVVGGKTLRIPGTLSKRESHVLRTRMGGMWHGEPKNAVKVRIPFPDKIDVAEQGGWSALERAYEYGVKVLLDKQGKGYKGTTK